MRCRGLILLLAVASACATTNSFRAQNRMNLLKLSPGMTKEQVLAVMGVGEQKVCCPLQTVTNPYRTESYTAKGARFEVLYYYTDRKTDTPSDRADQNGLVVQDDELMPLVLRDGKLDGWGWSFWQGVAAKYEIRIR